MDASEFQKHEGKRLRLEFRDGQVVRARLIHVDPGPPVELIYDGIEVLAQGREPRPPVKVGSGVSAKLDDVARYEIVP